MRLILLPLLLLAFAASADIYRWTDAEGNTVFGDNPPEGVDARPVHVQPPTTVPALRDARGILERGQENSESESASQRYERLRIASPGDDEAVRANNGNFTVSVEIVPALRSERGHRLRLILDGSTHSTSESPRFALENIDRGTHRISVQVLDNSDSVLQESETVEFHLLRHRIP
ncbi:MAG: DUF4124 domain-containing protein [Thioalkalivibrio sp.]